MKKQGNQGEAAGNQEKVGYTGHGKAVSIKCHCHLRSSAGFFTDGLSRVTLTGSGARAEAKEDERGNSGGRGRGNS